MEASKVNQVQKLLSFSKPTISQYSPTNTQRFFFLDSLEHNKNLYKKHFQVLTEKWKVRVQEHWKDQQCSKQFIVHVVKGGETLTSISRLYGMSVHSIAAVNEKLFDINLVLEGQRLNIPSSGVSNTNKDSMWRIRLYCIKARDRYQHSLTTFVGAGTGAGHGNHNVFTVLYPRNLPPVRTTGYILVVVPLIAFCIGCIINVFHQRVGKYLKRPVVNKSNVHHPRSRNIHWKTALSDIREAEVLDDESGQDSQTPHEDPSPVSFEDMSHAYTKIEPAYQKFLSECGMSESGYWRGGSPE